MEKKTSRSRSSVLRLRPVPRNCKFCNEGREPDYKKADELGSFVSDRAKIIGKARSGVCAKHQRRLAVAIKRARYLGLLSFAGPL